MDNTFSGGVLSDTIDGGRAGAEIELDPFGVRAHALDGESFFIRYGDCQVEIGGYNGKMVFCRDSDQGVTIFCEDRKFRKELSLASSGVLDEQLGDSLRRRRRTSRRDRTILVSVLAIILVLIVGGYFGVRVGARAAVKALPVSVDRQIGDAAFASMDLGGTKVQDEVVVGAMQQIVDRLAPHAATEGIEFEVIVVDAPVTNAFALPGGKIVVYTGLIANAENTNQVAGVLGHEMAHATLRHGLQRVGQSMGMYAAVTLLVGDAGGLMAVGADLFQVATINSYSREQEADADKEGVRMLHAAGIDPAPMSRFFEVMQAEQGDLPGAISWISTHPDHASRIETVNAIVSGLPEREYQPVDVDWEEIRRRVERPETTPPEKNQPGEE